MQSCTWTSDPPLRVGSTYDQVASFMGKSIVSSFAVVEFERDERIRIRTTTSTMPFDITRKVAAANTGKTIVSAIVRGGPGGLMRIFNPLMKIMVQRSVRNDYRRLKEILSEDAGALGG